MDQPPPLTPQEIAARQNAEYANIGQPQVVKIFGIMHLVLGAYGVLTALLAILAMIGFNPFLALIPKSSGATAQMNQQAAMQSEMMPVTIVSTIIAIATTVFIIMGGILMLKRRRSGLKWSNRYAWTSLLGKVVTVFATIVYTIPMMREMASSPAGSGMPSGTMETVMIGSAFFGIVLTCLYPVLSLILLNRPKVKEWFASQPD